jgi:hypothetical protein
VAPLGQRFARVRFVLALRELLCPKGEGAGASTQVRQRPKHSPEVIETARTAVGALLAYRQGDTAGFQAPVEQYRANPDRLATALFHLANVLADGAALASGQEGDQFLHGLAERMAAYPD